MADPPRDLFDPPAPAAVTEADNVIEFRRREPQDADRLDALARAARPPTACTHKRRRYVDDKQRRVTCGECGETLDPIWCLLTLIEYREHLARERESIDAEKRHVSRRREAAIARRLRARAVIAEQRARANCQRCGATGWAPVPGGGVVKCGCRRSAAKLV